MQQGHVNPCVICPAARLKLSDQPLTAVVPAADPNWLRKRQTSPVVS